MPLNDIPSLPGDYAMFDWTAHQASRDALVSGGLTAEFSKETWNAIAQTLSDALTAGGLAWDPKYTTLDEAKITQAYGDLRAAAFNSIRYNIDHPMPIGWKWARDPEFRGYVGREDFRGHDQYGAGCDDVYPEYILELVRKLNLLIGVMRGSHVYSMAYQRQILSACSGILRNPRSAVLEFTRMSGTEVSAPLLARLSALLEWAGMSASCQKSSAIALPSAVMRGEMASGTAMAADVEKPLSAAVEGLQVSESSFYSQVYARRIAYNDSWLKSETKSDSEMVNPVAAPAMAETASAAAEQAQANAVPSKWIAGQDASGTAESGTVAVPGAEPIQAAGTAQSGSDSDLALGEAKAASFSGRSETQLSVRADKLGIKSAAAVAAAESQSSAVIDSAWLPPVWVADGVLLIRQVYEANQNGTVLEVR